MTLSVTKTIKSSVWTKSSLFQWFVFSVAVIAVTLGTLTWVSGANAAQPVVHPPAVASVTTAKQVESSTDISGQKYEGMITDTHCGARHSAAIGLSAADCTRACVHGGNSFALVDGDTVYVLEGDAEALKKMAGQRVHITGTINGNKISVSAVAMDK